MESIILLVVVFFSLLVGFFLGIFFFTLETPLTRNLISRTPLAADQSPPSPPDETESETNPPPANKPAPGAKRILEVWLKDGKEIEYISLGKSYRKDDLPDSLIDLLKKDSDQKEDVSGQYPPGFDQPITQPVQLEMPEKKEVKLLSVIEEIDKILQKKLEESPLGEKGIQLMENQNQEIRIWVGLNSYNAIEEVPDPEIRALIIESVKDWENST